LCKRRPHTKEEYVSNRDSDSFVCSLGVGIVNDHPFAVNGIERFSRASVRAIDRDISPTSFLPSRDDLAVIGGHITECLALMIY
jgi:hypothetical protein